MTFIITETVTVIDRIIIKKAKKPAVKVVEHSHSFQVAMPNSQLLTIYYAWA